MVHSLLLLAVHTILCSLPRLQTPDRQLPMTSFHSTNPTARSPLGHLWRTSSLRPLKRRTERPVAMSRMSQLKRMVVRTREAKVRRRRCAATLRTKRTKRSFWLREIQQVSSDLLSACLNIGRYGLGRCSQSGCVCFCFLCENARCRLAMDGGTGLWFS